jgi:hypothetical protein
MPVNVLGSPQNVKHPQLRAATTARRIKATPSPVLRPAIASHRGIQAHHPRGLRIVAREVGNHELGALFEAVSSVDGNMAAAVETLAGVSVGHEFTTTGQPLFFRENIGPLGCR